jgi:PAS domain S-box-containing protein
MTQYLNSILNAFNDLLFVFSEDGFIENYLTSNHADELILPKEEFTGKKYQEILPPDVSKELELAFSQLNEGKEKAQFDYSINRNGEKNWYNAVISKTMVEDEMKYLGVVRNITERKNQELLLKSVLNTSPGGIMVFQVIRGENGSIIDYEISQLNKTVEKLTEVEADQLIGQRFTNILPDDLADLILERFNTVMETGEPADFEYHFETEPGKSIWYLSKVVKFKDGLVSTFLEMTKQKDAEAELLKANEELQELNRKKDKLFSVIAHDLRNATSGPMGIFELILEDFDEMTKEDLRKYLIQLEKGSRSAHELLEDLLLWSSNQFQDVIAEPESFNLNEIVDVVFRNVRVHSDNKKIDLINKVSNNVSLHADLNMVKTVLRNLINNGIKFSHPGGQIIVDAVIREEYIEISVRDQGVGIEKDAIEKILDKKSNFTTRGTNGEKGSGLGLDLCIDFVEKHGGDIRVESSPGKGSIFRFTIPDQLAQKGVRALEIK